MHTVAEWLGVTDRTIRNYVARCPEIAMRPYPSADRMIDVEKLAEFICPLRFVSWPDPSLGQQFSGDFSGIQHLSGYLLDVLDPDAVDLKASRFVKWFREQLEYECTGQIVGEPELRPLAMLWLLPCEAAAAIQWLERLAANVDGISGSGGATLDQIARQSIRSWTPRLQLIAETPL